MHHQVSDRTALASQKANQEAYVAACAANRAKGCPAGDTDSLAYVYWDARHTVAEADLAIIDADIAILDV